MAILRERTVWRKAPVPDPRRELSRLTATERENVLRALVVLHCRRGTWQAVASALQVDYRTMIRMRMAKQRVTVTFALRVARLLGEPLGEILTGRFPAPEACPTCGRA